MHSSRTRPNKTHLNKTVNPRSSPSDHYFHSKVPDSTKGGGRFSLNTKLLKSNNES